MSDSKSLWKAVPGILACAAIALSSASLGGTAQDDCATAQDEALLRAPAAALAATLAKSGRVSDGVRAGGRSREVLKEALRSAGIAPCEDGERCTGSALLEIADCGIAPLVTLRANAIALSQRWDFSSGTPRPASSILVTEA